MNIALAKTSARPCFVVCALVLGISGLFALCPRTIAAQANEDEAIDEALREDLSAPSQGTHLDPEIPTPRLGISLDLLGIVFGEITSTVDVSIAPWLAASLRGGWSQRIGKDRLELAVGMELWFENRGLAGLFLGIEAGALLSGPWNGTQDREDHLRASARAGYQLLWSDLSFSCSAGAAFFRGIQSEEHFVDPDLRFNFGVVF